MAQLAKSISHKHKDPSSNPQQYMKRQTHWCRPVIPSSGEVQTGRFLRFAGQLVFPILSSRFIERLYSKHRLESNKGRLLKPTSGLHPHACSPTNTRTHTLCHSQPPNIRIEVRRGFWDGGYGHRFDYSYSCMVYIFQNIL